MQHQRIELPVIIGAALFAFCHLAAPVRADSLSQETIPDTPAAVALQPDTSAHSDSAAIAMPAASAASQPPATSDSMSHRDSTLQNVLATLAKEDSLNAQAVPAPTPAPVTYSNNKNGRASPVVNMLMRHIPWTFVIIAALLLIIIIWIVAVRLTGKQAEKRFMTTTRLSLMNSEVQRACLHVEKHFADQSLTPAKLCAALVTGQPFLEALFERELGMSIAGYIAQVRVHRGRLFASMNPDADAAQVAFHVGMTDAKEFEDNFEKVTGGKFGEFREKTAD